MYQDNRQWRSRRGAKQSLDSGHGETEGLCIDDAGGSLGNVLKGPLHVVQDLLLVPHRLVLQPEGHIRSCQRCLHTRISEASLSS